MPKQRQFSGDEASQALINWIKDQKTAERLASSILHIDNFTEIDPSHPLGGRDGKRDIICKRSDKKYIVAVYFPRTQQKFNNISKKFQEDSISIDKNKTDGFIFFTNQYLTIGERAKLQKKLPNYETEIYHLERVASILNAPVGYGARLEFLDIELSKTEQLSYFAYKDRDFKIIQSSLSDLLNTLNQTEFLPNISTEKLVEFKEILKSIVEDNYPYLYGNSMIDMLRIPIIELKEFQGILNSLIGSEFDFFSPMNRLSVPLRELKEFQSILNSLIGSEFDFFSPINSLSVPLRELEKFSKILYTIVGNDNRIAPINKLSVPVRELEEYNELLDKTLEKLNKIKTLKSNI